MGLARLHLVSVAKISLREKFSHRSATHRMLTNLHEHYDDGYADSNESTHAGHSDRIDEMA